MRINFNSTRRRSESGYILLLVIVTTSVCLVLLGSMMYWVSSNAQQTQQNEMYTTAQAAAEAATEQVVATLDRDFVNSGLSAPSVYQALVPNTNGWPFQVVYSDGSGNYNKTGMSIGEQYFTNVLGSEFQNLSGYVQDCTIISTASLYGTYNVSATVVEQVHATEIPLFQFAVFYNLNLEIDPGNTMNILGAVFSNGGIWAGTPNVTFDSFVGAVGEIYDQTTDTTNDDPWASGKTDTGTPIANFDLGSPDNGMSSIRMPIDRGSNSASAVEGIINLPPVGDGAPNSYAYTTNGQMYMFNEADLIISNSINGTNGAIGTNNYITIWYQNSVNATPLTQITNDFYLLKLGPPSHTNVLNQTTGIDSISNVSYVGWSFVTNVQFYDYRESDNIKAVQLNVAALNVWLTNTAVNGGEPWDAENYLDKGNGINTLFIYNSVPVTSSQLPAVRLINGWQMPYTIDPSGSGRTNAGMTLVTPQPLYVKGDYNVQTVGSPLLGSAGGNTTYTYPAAIMGDAITILSSNWSDADTSITTLGSRTPTSTTVNAACLEGIVQSTNSNYSGGLENFLRLEENWTSSTYLYYNGSIVVMFPSIYATNFWQPTGNYYNPPNRQWAFDFNFTNPVALPPHTPSASDIIRFSWNSY
jgi:hypothetical protein